MISMPSASPANTPTDQQHPPQPLTEGLQPHQPQPQQQQQQQPHQHALECRSAPVFAGSAAHALQGRHVGQAMDLSVSRGSQALSI